MPRAYIVHDSCASSSWKFLSKVRVASLPNSKNIVMCKICRLGLTDRRRPVKDDKGKTKKMRDE